MKRRKELAKEYEDSLVAPSDAARPAAPAYRVPNRRVVEVCADEDSELGNKRFTSNCEVVRITEKDDLKSQSGLDKALNAVSHPNCLVIFSLPCTGGSNFTKVFTYNAEAQKKIRVKRKNLLRIARTR